MKKKTFFILTGSLLTLIFMIILDMQKVKTEEKPPLPTITIGDKAVTPKIESYSWAVTNNKIQDDTPNQLLY